jgi:hypothetical protein
VLGWCDYEFTLTLLKVIQPAPPRLQPLFVTTAADVHFGDGFYQEEIENGQPFRWMGER